MTREEAKSCIGTIEMLQRLAYNIHGVMDVIDADNCEKIIKALEQEPCEDTISRQAVLRIAEQGQVQGYEWQFKELIKLSPVTPQPNTGHWSRKTKVDAYDIAGVKTWGIKCQCDRCDFTTIVVEDFGYYNYCPNCGVKMVKPQESEVSE